MNKKIMVEVEQVWKNNGKRLRAEDVVQYASEHPDSELHAKLEWDDEKAGHLYRVQQARELIRVCVIRLPHIAKPVRAYVSVPSDRTEGEGYRRVDEVLGASQFRSQVVLEAMTRIANMRESYAYLPELTPLFDELDMMINRHRAALQVETGAA